MTPSRWLGYVKEHTLSDDAQDYAIWTELVSIARACCNGEAETIDWSAVARHLNAQFRSAYKYLKQLEGTLPEGHPGLQSTQTLRNLLLAMRESLDEARLALGRRHWEPVQHEHQEVRKGLQLLGKAVARLDEALECGHCQACKLWQAGSVCSRCRRPLETFDFARDERAEVETLSPEYRRLRELADHIHQHPEDSGHDLREHALYLAHLLQATEAPTRGLIRTNPEAPVEELLDYLRGARASLVEMAEWPNHRDFARLEKGWLLLRDQLGRFEQGLEDHDRS